MKTSEEIITLHNKKSLLPKRLDPVIEKKRFQEARFLFVILNEPLNTIPVPDSSHARAFKHHSQSEDKGRIRTANAGPEHGDKCTSCKGRSLRGTNRN